MKWEDDSERGGSMPIEKIIEQLDIQEMKMNQRCDIWLKQKKKQEMIWRGIKKEKDDKYQEELDGF